MQEAKSEAQEFPGDLSDSLLIEKLQRVLRKHAASQHGQQVSASVSHPGQYTAHHQAVPISPPVEYFVSKQLEPDMGAPILQFVPVKVAAGTRIDERQNESAEPGAGADGYTTSHAGAGVGVRSGMPGTGAEEYAWGRVKVLQPGATLTTCVEHLTTRPHVA